MITASLPRDANRIPVLGAVLNTDGLTVTALQINPIGNLLKVSDGMTGTDYSSVNIQRDANRIPTIWGVSSVDGVTLVSIYINNSGNLLVDSN